MKPFDRSLLQIFASEQAEHVGRIRVLLEILAGSGADGPAFEELQRRAHTLKGAAHAVGLESTETLVHRLESVFARIGRGDAAFNAEVASLAEYTLQAFEDILAAALADREPPDMRDLEAALDSFVASGAGSLEQPALGHTVEAEPPQGVSNAPAASAPANAESDLVRVSARRIDRLVQSSSEMLIAAAWKAEGADPFAQHIEQLEDLQKQWRQLRHNPVRRNDDSEAELNNARSCLRYMDRELDSLLSQAYAAAGSLELRAREVRRRAGEVYEDVCRIRMTPAETVFAGSGALIRDLAHQENKRIEFRVEGLETQADRMVLQALKDPVMHLLRNAVSHGAETEAQRASRGKAPANTVRMTIRSSGDRLNLTIEDDGRGINESAVMEEASRRGLLPSETATQPSVTSLLLIPGLSTAKELTSLAGRGLGLSIVQEAVVRLQGTLSIRSVASGGTRVSISVPLAISTQRILLVSAAELVFGVASSFVDRLLRVAVSEIQMVEGKECVAVGAEAVRLVRLADLLGIPAKPGDAEGETRKLDVVVFSVNDARHAVVVDRLLDERDAIIKDSGLVASQAGFSAGGVPLDDGGVAVVLNVPDLFTRTEGRVQAARFRSSEPEMKKASILVVDDSLTTRSLERNILEAHGYRVRVAVDGIDALEQVRAEKPDLVISDVMMPRMTGFELLEQLKRDPALRDVPLVLVTSLETEEEQSRGLELGADAYIVKRRFDQGELMRIVRQIV